MLPYDSLHLMLSRGLISFADRPRHQLEINLITNILPWTIGRLWIHHKILTSTNAPTSRFGFASFWCKGDKAWSILSFSFFFFFYILIMDLVLPVHKASIQAQFGLPSSNAVYYNFAIQGIFSLFYHMEDATLFLNTGASLSRAWSHTKDFSLQAHLSLLGRSVPQLSCSASIFFSLAALLRITRVSCKYHLYKRRLMFYGLEAIERLFFFFSLNFFFLQP